MESIRKADAEATAARRAAAHASHDSDDSYNEYVASEESSSDDALQLPKQRNLVNGDYDDTSLQLPRQGVVEDDGFRHSRVGFAV
jgi:multidrug resistance efflux pump